MIDGSKIGMMARKKQVITIAGGTNINISNAWLTSNGWDGVRSVVVQNTGNIVSSTTATAALIISATMPAGRRLSFENATNGAVYGKGGGNTVNTQNGGTGLNVTAPVIIDNRGIIAGGGGNGGNYGDPYYSGNGADQNAATAGASGSASGTTGRTTATNGAAGNNSYGATGTGYQGAGGIAWVGTDAKPGCGGGGAWGSSGGVSGNGSSPALTLNPPGAGGAAVSGNSNITWTTTGNRYGSIG